MYLRRTVRNDGGSNGEVTAMTLSGEENFEECGQKRIE